MPQAKLAGLAAVAATLLEQAMRAAQAHLGKVPQVAQVMPLQAHIPAAVEVAHLPLAVTQRAAWLVMVAQARHRQLAAHP
jgi:hypothetical protein